MTRRRITSLVAAVALIGLGVTVGVLVKSTSSAHAASQPVVKTAAPLRAGYVCMTEFMARSHKWQKRAADMQLAREREGQRLALLREVLLSKKAQASTAQGERKIELEQEVVETQRKFEDEERGIRQDLDRRAADVLRQMHQEFARVIEQVARERNLDVVHAYPAKPDHPPERMPEAQYLDMFFRPPAMTPLYLKDGVDLTTEVVSRMNKAYAAVSDDEK
jgi:Skp family chaperone for outer membrane proteins